MNEATFITGIRNNFKKLLVTSAEELERDAFTFPDGELTNYRDKAKYQRKTIRDFFYRDIAEELTYEEFNMYNKILKDIEENINNLSDENYKKVEQKIVYFQLLLGMDISYYVSFKDVIARFIMSIKSKENKTRYINQLQILASKQNGMVGKYSADTARFIEDVKGLKTVYMPERIKTKPSEKPLRKRGGVATVTKKNTKKVERLNPLKGPKITNKDCAELYFSIFKERIKV